MKVTRNFTNRSVNAADDLYTTDDYICRVTVKTKKNKKGDYQMSEQRTYYPKTARNMWNLERLVGRVRKERW